MSMIKSSARCEEAAPVVSSLLDLQECEQYEHQKETAYQEKDRFVLLFEAVQIVQEYTIPKHLGV